LITFLSELPSYNFFVLWQFCFDSVEYNNILAFPTNELDILLEVPS